MPGQRKRKHRRERAHHRTREVLGYWETLFSTGDQAELREYIRRLYAEGTVTDPERLRLSTLCGRLAHPTTYEVSHFVPEVVSA
ncbi:hypothetical protein ACODT5_34575 [Streptomyces sp. 5.8]|uniref:hypothetical protein n=1 Tax=Streptomyces sp. 5.8 TaxID=3406571 RepID=UPI003BB6EAE7